jgi:hypothetical protein
MSKCCGILGFIFGHKFKPRYSEKLSLASNEVTLEAIKNIRESYEKLCGQVKAISTDQELRKEGQQQIVEVTKVKVPIEKHYHRDICIRCGTEVMLNLPLTPTPTRRLDTDI